MNTSKHLQAFAKLPQNTCRHMPNDAKTHAGICQTTPKHTQSYAKLPQNTRRHMPNYPKAHAGICHTTPKHTQAYAKLLLCTFQNTRRHTSQYDNAHSKLQAGIRPSAVHLSNLSNTRKNLLHATCETRSNVKEVRVFHTDQCVIQSFPRPSML